MSSLFNLQGKTVIVTGGYGHLGSAIAEGLLKQNARVIVAGRSAEKFDEKFKHISDKRFLLFRPLDITDTQSINSLFETVFKEFASIDVLINNAHTAKGGGQEDMLDEDWAYTMDGVLGSVHKCIKGIIPYLKKQQSGKIINISSMYGVVSPDFRLYHGDDCEKYTNPPHYGAAKAGVIQLTKYFAVYLGKYNIQVNSITPGPFPKIAIQQENVAFIERLKSRNPLGRIGVPEDLIGVSVLLSSKGSDFITGQNLIVDGGWTIW